METIKTTCNLNLKKAPISSLTWGHNDRRLFVATGCAVHVAWVSPRRMASLQHLARLKLRRCLKTEQQLDRIAEPMPSLIRNLVASLFSSTVHVPEAEDYVCRPPASNNTRLYCTMIRRDQEEEEDGQDVDATGGVAFTLYLEFLGGLIPLLKVLIFARLIPATNL